MTRKHLLFLFLDGVGLGADDLAHNPFSAAKMPTLVSLLGEGWFLGGQGPILNQRASLVPIDACLGVPGRPQSATGQATLLTGRNVPAEIGQHFGPKPSPEIAAILDHGNLFSSVQTNGGSAVFLNPYPPRFFEGIASGRRLLSAIPLAAKSAGLKLFTHADLMAGRAVSPDFTGEGWRDRLGFRETPVLSLREAGIRLAQLAQDHTFSFFEHWPTDLVGHRRNYPQAVRMMERFDEVLAGLLDAWDWESGQILITSDHGNVEDLGVRTHTMNPVPAIFIGRDHDGMAKRVRDLTDVAPAVRDYLIG
jgi:hypothetical protein